ncbi:hypothetical protein HK104_009700 [Borealophlyctis nickersoniae]|nr:hypothetical protein HK104_009700 [Borealophlyctis nickersoniae]
MTSNKGPTPPTTTSGPTPKDTDVTTTTNNNKGNGNNRGSQRPLRCPTCVCKRTFRTARDLRHHLNSGIHNGHSDTCDACQRNFRRLPGVRFRTLSGVVATTTTTNKKGNGNNRGSQCPVGCPVCVCKRTFQAAPDLQRHLNSGIHDDHSVTCALCQSIFRTLSGATFPKLSGLTFHLEERNSLALARAQVEQLENRKTQVDHQIPTCPDKITSDGKDSVLHSSTILVLRLGTDMTVRRLAELAKDYGAIESIEMDFTISQSAFYDLYYKRLARIVFTSPAAATRAQEAIDGLVVDGRKLFCDIVPDRAFGNIPSTLSVSPVAYVNPTTFVYSSYDTQTPCLDSCAAPVTQRNPQSSRGKMVIRLQKAVPAPIGVKDVIVDLAGDENTINDRSDRGPPRTAPAAKHSTASASNPVSQASTRERPHLSPSESRSRDPLPETSRMKVRFDADATTVRSNQDSDFMSTDFTSSSDAILADRSKVSPSDGSQVSQGVETTPLVPESPGRASPTSSIEARTSSSSLPMRTSPADVPEARTPPATCSPHSPRRSPSQVTTETIMTVKSPMGPPSPIGPPLRNLSPFAQVEATTAEVGGQERRGSPAKKTSLGAEEDRTERQTPARMNRPGMTPFAGGADHDAENDPPSNELESRRTGKVGADTFTPLRQPNEPEVATSRKKATKSAAETKKPSTRSVRSETPLQDEPKHESMSLDDLAPATPKTKSAKLRKAEATPARTIVTRRMARSETPLQDDPKHEPTSLEDLAPATPKTKSAKSRKTEATPVRTIVTRRMAKTLSGGDPE